MLIRKCSLSESDNMAWEIFTGAAGDRLLYLLTERKSLNQWFAQQRSLLSH